MIYGVGNYVQEIHVMDNKGNQWKLKEKNETETIKAFFEIVKKGNPDVFQVFNSVLLNFLYKRCLVLGLPFLEVS